MNFRLKKFLSYYKPYLGLFVFVMLCSFIVAGMNLVFPLLTRHITKNVLQGNQSGIYRQIIIMGLLMLGLIVLYLFCNFFVDYKGHAMGAMMERDMRNELFAHYQKLSFSFYDEHRTGKLMSRITNDLLSLAELYHHGPEDYVINLVKFIGTFIILMHINVRLTLAVFLFLPVMAVFSFYLNRILRKVYKTNYDRIGDVNAQVEDNLSGIRVVQSFANEEIENKKFSYENDRFLDSRKSIYKNEAYLYNGMNAFTQLITATVVIAGAAGIVKESIDLADLLAFILYTGNIIEPIQRLNWIVRQFHEGVTAFGRFIEITSIEPDIKDSETAQELLTVNGDVEFKNVSFKYRDNQEFVLEKVNLKVKAGDYLAIVGTSGIGKTTLCSLIPRFYEASDGEVLLDGMNVKDIRLSDLRKNIGVVQQDTYLFFGTVMDNICYGKPDAAYEEVIEAAKKANAHDFIMKLPAGYDTDIGQRGIKLSGGQKQRLSIARVFLKNPPVLILDEATSSLDNESEKVVQDSLERLAMNRTTFVIAHRLSTIKNAKRIIVLTDKGIVEQGNHHELLDLNGTYAHLYNVRE